MYDLKEKKKRKHEKEMDFHGQKLSETIYQILILAFSVRSSICKCGDVFSLSLSLSLKAFYQNDVDVRRVQILAFVAGYQTQDFATTFYGWFIGTSLAVAICVPDWWFYNQFPVEFLDEIPEPTTRSRIHGGRKKKRRNK